ncbi:hypothetical protein [Nocardia brasiliensis]|uniref:hypothetical protein n=1 Tax=Nocardia brasiliensis TaxID=37326 RepID=UPI00245564A2|nr:hypothetical protein [Nocardia brasiliensis]
MKRPSDIGKSTAESVAAVRLAFIEAARPIEDAMSATNHGFTIELREVTALVDGLPLREPLPDAIRRFVSDPIRSVRPIKPASRWPQLLHAVMQPMRPWRLGRYGATFDSGPGPTLDEILSLAETLESHLGSAQVAARVELMPAGYYANIFEHFVVITRSHAALLALMVTD